MFLQMDRDEFNQISQNPIIKNHQERKTQRSSKEKVVIRKQLRFGQKQNNIQEV
jgi:hypothetical protein